MQTELHYSGARILQVPYDSGRKNFRMGLGPGRLIEQGIGSLPGVSVETIEVLERPFELGTTIRVLRSISEKVNAAVRDQRFPIVLAGGCISSVGTVAGTGSQPLGVIWLDAHGDFNTPETTASGFIDGMALAALTGRCWRNLMSSIGGFQPLPEKNAVLVGARHFDPEEKMALDRSNVEYIETAKLRDNGFDASVDAALARLPERVCLHIDLDVLDRNEARVNEYSSSGGLTLAELQQIIGIIGYNRAIVAAAITAYDPSVDSDGKAANSGIAVAEALLAAACIHRH